jgi:DhnA family fructose-bisphosphate aldolase class Ia
MSAAYRLNRLFHPDSGRCIDVAVDHGFFGEAALHTGIEDMDRRSASTPRASAGTSSTRRARASCGASAWRTSRPRAPRASAPACR